LLLRPAALFLRRALMRLFLRDGRSRSHGDQQCEQRAVERGQGRNDHRAGLCLFNSMAPHQAAAYTKRTWSTHIFARSNRSCRETTMPEALRRKLTNAGRVLASQDQGDFVAGHVTARLPDDPGRLPMKPATIGLDEMTPDNIITVDLDGQDRKSTRLNS